MKYEPAQPAILQLADGTRFHGTSAGIAGSAMGEVAFNTGMVGYQEVFTDPSYAAQLITMTAAHIGNYGVRDAEAESRVIQVAGVICKKCSPIYSRPAATESLSAYFQRHSVVAIADVDTRALVRHIRKAGAMNAIISTETFDAAELSVKLKECPDMEGLELSSHVSTSQAYNEGAGNLKVALVDFGVKANIVRMLVERGATVRVFPMHSTLTEILDWNPDGILLSNGPGDPAAMTSSVSLVKELLAANLPMFGICLGHQLLGLALGLLTGKMHNGHRGINHPVKNLMTDRSEITSQNHGFTVLEGHSEQGVVITHKHLNDQSVAGLRLANRPVFSVQYHPESSPGPNDSRYLFDDFMNSLTIKSA